ncbi:MAG: CvpA family protein [Alphaproteobacteria bacterium]|nr:CvpA family protein [Alphaproteobacteria bacterium]
MEQAQQVSTFYLNSFDIAVLVIIGLSSVFALFRGFVREMLSLLGWIASTWITFTFLNDATAAMEPHFSSKNPAVAKAAAGAALFFGSLIFFWILNSIIFAYIKAIKAGAVDRSLGFAFGFFRGVFLVSLAFLMYSTVMPSEKDPEWFAQAQTKRLVEIGAGAIRAISPGYFDELGKTTEGIAEAQKSLNAVTEGLQHKGAGTAPTLAPGKGLPTDSQMQKILNEQSHE